MRMRSSRPSIWPMLLLVIVGAILYTIWGLRPASPEAANQVVAPPAIAAQPTEATVTDAQLPAPAAPTPATRSVVPTGTRVFIPKAGIISDVIESYLENGTWDVSQLGSNVGHLQGTAWLNQPGNMVLSGHVEMADGRPGVFANLDKLEVDDLIRITVDDLNYDYIIREIYMTTPDDLTPVMPVAGERLTLITCGNYDFVQDLYLERMIVVAERI